MPGIARRLAGDLLDALVPATCAACDAPSLTILCARCDESVVGPPPSPLACAMFGGALADAIRRAKFTGDAGVARSLGAWWVERLNAGRCPPLPAIDGVAFVPAPWRRRVVRGFDLPALLASSLARYAQVPVVDALACTRTDAPLSFGADKAARATAVSGRYRARALFTQRTLLLVDDVHTTGATLGEARRVLEAAGAVVTPAAFAVAP